MEGGSLGKPQGVTNLSSDARLLCLLQETLRKKGGLHNLRIESLRTSESTFFRIPPLLLPTLPEQHAETSFCLQWTAFNFNESRYLPKRFTWSDGGEKRGFT